MRFSSFTLLLTAIVMSQAAAKKKKPVHTYTYSFSDFTGYADIGWYEADCPQMYSSFYVGGSDSTTKENSDGTPSTVAQDSVYFYYNKYNMCNDTFYKATYISDVWAPESSVVSVDIGPRLKAGTLTKTAPASVREETCVYKYCSDYGGYYFYECTTESDETKLANVAVSLTGTKAWTSTSTYTNDYRTPTTRFRYKYTGTSRDASAIISLSLDNAKVSLPECSSASYCSGSLGKANSGSIDVYK